MHTASAFGWRLCCYGMFEKNGDVHDEHEQDNKAIEEIECGDHDVETCLGMPGNAEQQKGGQQ